MKRSHGIFTAAGPCSFGIAIEKRVLGFVFLVAVLLAASADRVGASDDTTAAALAFRSAVSPPPANWRGPVFELSHDYPDSLAADCQAGGPWRAVDVDFAAATPTWKGGWKEYMEVILNYISLGQDPQLDNKVGWQVSPNGTPRWYHVPWMSFDKLSGREFVHGLTNELSVFHSAFEGPGRATGTHTLPP